MDELTPEELALLTPEEREEYLSLVQDQESSDSITTAPQPADLKPIESPKEDILSKAYGFIKPKLEPILEVGAAVEKGFEQGVLSGGAEEARAAAMSAMTGRDYESIKKEQEELFKKSEEENLLSTAAGELLGSVAQGALVSATTGGAGLPVSIANSLNKLSKVNKAAKLAFNVIKPTARIAKTAAIGGAEGALSGTLRSEKSLQEQAKEDFKEAKQASLSGAALGTGIEGAGKIIKGSIGAAGDFLSKKIDEGKLFPSARAIREAWRYGKKGVGFSSEKSLNRPMESLMKVIETDIQPKIQKAMRDTKDLSDYILKNAPHRIDIDEPINSAIAKLRSEGNLDANKLADYISNKYKAIKKAAEPPVGVTGVLGETPSKIPIMDAKLFIRDLNNELKSKPQMHATFQETVRKVTKDLDNIIDSTVTDNDALELVLKDPEQAINFFNILRNTSPSALAEQELKKVSSIMTEDKAIKAANKLANVIGQSQKSINSILDKLDELPMEAKISQMADILKNPSSKNILLEAGKNLGPIKVLDNKMKNILSAQELLTGELFPKTDVEKAEQVMNLFRIISGQTKEGISADINKAKYEKAMDFLSAAFPEVSESIYKKVKPVADDLFMVRYLHGLGFDPALKDTAVVQKVLGPATKLTAQAANIAGQTLRAAEKGISGPVVGIPTTTLLRPTKSVLETLQKKVEGRPGPISKMVNDRLKDALNSPDEGRRIAILNTLMQYSYFRDLVKEEEE